MNPFQILGIPTTRDKDAIRKAFRSKSLTAHPDRGGDAKEYQQLSAAYDAAMEFAERGSIPQQPHDRERCGCRNCFMWRAARAQAQQQTACRTTVNFNGFTVNGVNAGSVQQVIQNPDGTITIVMG